MILSRGHASATIPHDDDDTDDDDTDDNGAFVYTKGFRWRFIQNKKRLPCVETSLLSGWGTRITRKGRTRICSVTITPYPKLKSFAGANLSFAGAKVALFSETTKKIEGFL